MKNSIDLNKELRDLLFTDKDTEAISSPLLHTQYRRTEEGLRQNCLACNPSLTVGYIEGQSSCPYCLGHGYIFDEKIIRGYLYKQNSGQDKYNLKYFDKAGKLDTASYLLITDKTINIKEEDKISILKLDDKGLISVPIRLISTHRVVADRNMVASRTNSDFNLNYLGG